MFRSFLRLDLWNNSIIITALLISFTVGCDSTVRPGVDLENAATVNPKYLYDITQGKPFKFHGSDDKFYYFQTKDGFYRITNEFSSKSLEMLRPKNPENEMGFSRVSVIFADENTIAYSKGRSPDF